VGYPVLSDLDSRAVAAALEAVADVQLKIDADDFIIAVSVTNPDLSDLRHQPWQGRRFTEIVSSDQTERARQALSRARANPGTAARADLDHSLPGSDQGTPISYRFVCSEEDEAVVAVGIDLRAVSNLRQQLVNAQQAMEQDYWSTRQIENRYRRLFEMANDAFVVVDEVSGRILEANPQASRLLVSDGQNLVGRPFPIGFVESGTDALLNALADARATGGSQAEVPLAGIDSDARLAISYLRQGSESRYLIKINAINDLPLAADDVWSDLVEQAADAILVLDESGVLIHANRTFLDWTQVASIEAVLGRSADDYIGRSSVDVTVLLNNLRQQGKIRLYASTLRSVFGTTSDIEISAARVNTHDGPRYALFIRDVSHRVTAEHPMTEQLPRSIEQITRRVGRVPLKELVRESTDVIEALCIDAALQLTKDNRASAAELLGLSRQSLYTKLRRYGIGEGD
jgi:transcriptional regulator PpsR